MDLRIETSGFELGRLVAIDLLAFPYFAWANRGPSEMAVWMDESP